MRLLQQTLIVRQLAFVLRLEQFVRTVVDLREQVALLDVLALFEGHLHQYAVDLRAHGDGGEWGNCTEAAINDLDVSGADSRDADGLRRTGRSLAMRAVSSGQERKRDNRSNRGRR